MNLRRKEILLTPKGHDMAQRIDEVLALNRTFLERMFADDAANCPPWLKLALSHPQRSAIPAAP